MESSGYDPAHTTSLHQHTFEPTLVVVRVTARCRDCSQITTELIEVSEDWSVNDAILEAKERFRTREKFP